MPDDLEDIFFLENLPLSVSFRYGQNSDIDPPGSSSGLDALVRSHDMSYVKRFSFATAVHIRCVSSMFSSSVSNSSITLVLCVAHSQTLAFVSRISPGTMNVRYMIIG